MGIADLGKKIDRVIGKNEYKRISIYDIKPNPKNRKDLRDIEALSISILDNGLLQPLEVMEEDDHYVLLGGERRYHALSKLIDEDLFDEMVPCFLYKNYEDNIIEKIHMYQSNGHSSYNKEELKQAIYDLNEAYDYLNKKGKRVDYIGGTLGVSPRTVQKYLNELKKASSTTTDEDVENNQEEETYDKVDLKKDFNKLIKQFYKLDKKIIENNLSEVKFNTVELSSFIDIFRTNFELLEEVIKKDED